LSIPRISYVSRREAQKLSYRGPERRLVAMPYSPSRSKRGRGRKELEIYSVRGDLFKIFGPNGERIFGKNGKGKEMRGGDRKKKRTVLLPASKMAAIPILRLGRKGFKGIAHVAISSISNLRQE